MIEEFPKALYRGGDVHGGEFVLVADAEEEAAQNALGFFFHTQRPDDTPKPTAKLGRPKKD